MRPQEHPLLSDLPRDRWWRRVDWMVLAVTALTVLGIFGAGLLVGIGLAR